MKRRPVFDEVAEVAKRVDEVAASLSRPRDVTWLIDLAASVGCGPGALVLDVGGYAGAWARRLDDRFGSKTVVCDVAHSAIELAVEADSPALVADLQELPCRSRVFDVVWCRDVLSMIDEPERALAEACRVLRPGGGLVLYTAVPTDRLEPAERDELFSALAMPEWWNDGAEFVRELLARSGFDMLTESKTSPEHTQANIEAQGELLQDWALLAQLERAPDASAPPSATSGTGAGGPGASGASTFCSASWRRSPGLLGRIQIVGAEGLEPPTPSL